MAVRPPQHADDAELMARLADGDTAALGALVRRYQQYVLALAYRTSGDRQQAEDIAQTAFLRVWRSARRYEPTAKFTTWLHRIVVNLCLDAAKKRRPRTGDLQDVTAASREDPRNSFEQAERAEAVRKAVARLPHRQRVCVVLHRFSGLSNREIAASTGWSESAVESLLVRAYRALREMLRDYQET